MTRSVHGGEPLGEIPEARATGTIAATYADIRDVVGSPVVNLVWRHLATRPGWLEAAWTAVRPHVASVDAPALLVPAARRLAHDLRVEPIAIADPRIAATLEAFDRGNACNLLALTVLADAGTGLRGPGGPAGPTRRRPREDVGEILPATAAVAAEDRAAFEHLAASLRHPDSGIPTPTLLRHLASSPGLLAALGGALSDLGLVLPPAADALRRHARSIAPRADAVRPAAETVRVVEPFAELIGRAIMLTALVRRAIEGQ